MFSTWSSEMACDASKSKMRLIRDYFLSLRGKLARAGPVSVLCKHYAKAPKTVPRIPFAVLAKDV